MPLKLTRRPFCALYVHVPFCRRKCGYCAFYSVDRHDAELRTLYFERLERDFTRATEQCGSLRSVFVGGGTPSVFTEMELDRLIHMIKGRFVIPPGCEFTVECNPESLTDAKLRLLHALGINRISLGIQSFDPGKRARLMRQGDPDVVEARLAAALRCFDNVNADLIYGVPGETAVQWGNDLSRALRHRITHLSTYALTVEEGTRLAQRDDRLPDDGEFVRFWAMAEERAQERGLQRYEVSNLALPGCKCRHNLSIWHGAPYLGCGPAAASFNGVDRWRNPDDLAAWLDETPPVIDRLPPEERAAEIMAFGLRTVDGWTTAEFENLTGVTPATLRPRALQKLEEQGLIEVDAVGVRPTRKGLLFADTIAQELI